MTWPLFPHACELTIKMQKNGFIVSVRKKIENWFGLGSLATKSGGSGWALGEKSAFTEVMQV